MERRLLVRISARGSWDRLQIRSLNFKKWVQMIYGWTNAFGNNNQVVKIRYCDIPHF